MWSRKPPLFARLAEIHTGLLLQIVKELPQTSPYLRGSDLWDHLLSLWFHLGFIKTLENSSVLSGGFKAFGDGP